MTDLSFLSLKGLRGRWILQNLNCFAQLSGSWQRSDSFENRGATPEAKILNRLQMFRGDVFRNTVADLCQLDEAAASLLGDWQRSRT